GMRGARQGMRGDDVLAGLVPEQVNGMRGMVPEQVIGPAAWFVARIEVAAPEEVGLGVQLPHGELARFDPAVYPGVRRVEPPGMADHADQAGFPLDGSDLAGVAPVVGERD